MVAKSRTRLSDWTELNWIRILNTLGSLCFVVLFFINKKSLVCCCVVVFPSVMNYSKAFDFGLLLLVWVWGKWASLVTQVVKNLPTRQETQVWSLSWEDPWRREWLPTPVFLPENLHGQRSLEGYSPLGSKELDMTEWLTLSLSRGRGEIKHWYFQKAPDMIDNKPTAPCVKGTVVNPTALHNSAPAPRLHLCYGLTCPLPF